MQIKAGTENPLFTVEVCDFGVFCKSFNCESIYWYDNKGSVGKYYNYLGKKKEIAIQKEKELNDKLLNLSISNLNEIKEDISGLLTILDLGIYSVNFQKSEEENGKYGLNYYNIIFPKFDKSNLKEEELTDDFKMIFNKLVSENGNYIPADIVDYSAISFYDGCETFIIATKKESELDNSRVEFYREHIKKGKRPPIIVLTCTHKQSTLNSFIIDGHHKALAYIQEKVNPALINISGEAKYVEDTLSKLKHASTLLFKDQFEYLILSNYASDLLNEEICKDEYLRKYCLDGWVEKKYPNGITRLMGNYLNNKKNGIIEWFYPDGSLEKRQKYENDKYICTYESYFYNGKLLQRGNESGLIESYDIYGSKTS